MGTGHGTTAHYHRGCRCVPCKAAWAEYMRAYKHEHGLAKPRDARFYAGPFEATAAKLTPLAKALLAAAAERTERAPDDILEQLVREHVGDVAFEADVLEAE